ncbi:MAG: anti-sigma factor antagonist [Oscillospiraceae bacterium]|nr:anti-sigma factor antagonist [Oscillospiraceae bacterium]
MKTTTENNILTVYLDGRIDTNNAPQVEKEIFDAIGQDNEKQVIFDAEKLEYISSAGLRVLMKVAKTTDKRVTVFNVSRDVYDIFDTTGFTELFDVKKALRKVSLAGCEVIGQGGHGKVYRLDEETIIKVYHDNSSLSLIEKEREYAKNAFVHGVPSAIAYDIVETEEGYGLVFEMAGAVTVSRFVTEHPERLQEYAVKFGTLLKTLNSTEADPKLYGDIRQIYLERAEKARKYFTDEENEQLVRMINSVPDGSGMVHGDYHTNNVMVQSDGELVLIDMADISRGNTLFDIGGTFLVMYIAGMNDPNVTKWVIGLDYELSKQIWGITLATYYGTTDKQKLEFLGQRCGAFALMRMATTLGIDSNNVSGRSEAMVAMLRERLFPNTDNFCKLFAMPV